MNNFMIRKQDKNKLSRKSSDKISNKEKIEDKNKVGGNQSNSVET